MVRLLDYIMSHHLTSPHSSFQNISRWMKENCIKTQSGLGLSTNQGKIEKLTTPATSSTTSTMKLLIVLGLIPLFSAQQMGFFGFPTMMGDGKTQGTPKKGYKNNNNNMWDLNSFPGFGTLSSGSGKKTYSNNGNNKQNQKDNLFGLTEINI